VVAGVVDRVMGRVSTESIRVAVTVGARATLVD